MNIEMGHPIPDIVVATTQEPELALRSLLGKNLIMYFYPKDNTPGCTTQGQNFRDAFNEFKKRNTIILGVSRESIRSHTNFINKHQFPFDLISDPDETLCSLFDVIKEKNLYGRKYMGIERSTFIFDASGILRHEIRKVKVKGHIEHVLDLIDAM